MRHDEKRMAILKTLRDGRDPVNSAGIVRMLTAAGLPMSERSVRLHLAALDAEGLTQAHGRRGRTITDRGRAVLRAPDITHRVGMLSARIDQMTYRMNFDLPTRSGHVVVNISYVDPDALHAQMDKVCKVFAEGYAMGTRAALLAPGEMVGDEAIPAGKVGFCTVCSITVNGVLLKHGVPTASRFGGLLEVQDGRAARFAEIIHYDGTSIDPLEVFIRSGMTDYCGAIRNGNGRIGASFREYPEDSRELVMLLSRQLDDIGLGAIMEMGLPGQPLLSTPVSTGRFGAIVVGGLNPVAVLEETGHRVVCKALSGLMEYNRLHHYEELPRRLKALRSARPA